MLAWLLRGVVVGLLATAVLGGVLVVRAGLAWPWWALAPAAVLLLPAAVLGLEFMLLARWGRDPEAPPASLALLLRAWWGEVGASTRAFGWRQPFASGREPDVPGRPGQRGVVLVHGFVCNRGLWSPWLRRLRAAGAPAIAVTMEPVFGAIDVMVPTLDAAVARLQAQTGQTPLVVAHSMGGLVVRAWLRRHAADDRVAGVITIASPHHGTWLARFSLSANGRQMRRHSAWLSALAQAEPAARRERFTCFWSHCDNIVFPAGTARLAGAVQRHLDGAAHLAMLDHPAVFDEVMRQLR